MWLKTLRGGYVHSVTGVELEPQLGYGNDGDKWAVILRVNGNTAAVGHLFDTEGDAQAYVHSLCNSLVTEQNVATNAIADSLKPIARALSKLARLAEEALDLYTIDKTARGDREEDGACG